MQRSTYFTRRFTAFYCSRAYQIHPPLKQTPFSPLSITSAVSRGGCKYSGWTAPVVWRAFVSDLPACFFSNLRCSFCFCVLSKCVEFGSADHCSAFEMVFTDSGSLYVLPIWAGDTCLPCTLSFTMYYLPLATISCFASRFRDKL